MKTAKKKAATKGCTCIDQVNEQLEEDGFRVSRGLQLNFATGESSLSPPMLVVEKTGEVKTRKRLPLILCRHCPVCGKKI